MINSTTMNPPTIMITSTSIMWTIQTRALLNSTHTHTHKSIIWLWNWHQLHWCVYVITDECALHRGNVELGINVIDHLWTDFLHVLSVLFFSSSAELKAQVSFSDRLLSVACLTVCLSVHKLCTFSFSSAEPLGQFQPNLAQSIFGWRGFNFVQM